MSEGNCKEQVFRDWHNYPCSRKAWKDGYCKQHHPDSVKARDAERTRKWEVKKEESPYRKIETLNADLTALRAENERLKADRECIPEHPINSDCKPNLKVTYCYSCGTNIKQQKFCHGCGRKINWAAVAKYREK